MSVDVNFVAVLVAAIAATAVGFLWYSPMVLGKPWMKLMGYTSATLKDEQKKMGMYYGLSFALAVLTAYVLYHVMVMSMNFFHNPAVMTGLMTAFWSWLGFIMPVQATTTIFGHEQAPSSRSLGSKKWQLFGINTGFQLASLLAMGLVIGMIVG